MELGNFAFSRRMLEYIVLTGASRHPLLKEGSGLGLVGWRASLSKPHITIRTAVRYLAYQPSDNIINGRVHDVWVNAAELVIALP